MFNATFIVASCLSLYWVTVVIKSVRMKQHHGQSANVLPKEKVGQLTRIIWAPVVVCLIMFPWLAYAGVITMPAGLFWSMLRVFAAGLAIVTTLLTFWCWYEMGNAWRMGINPKEKTQLIISGPFSYSRHPIYSLSIMLALAALFAVPSIPMLFIVGVKILLLWQEALREERDMLLKHGDEYQAYQQRVGRFLPR